MDRLTATHQRTTNALLSGDNFLQSWKIYRSEIRKKCAQSIATPRGGGVLRGLQAPQEYVKSKTSFKLRNSLVTAQDFYADIRPGPSPKILQFSPEPKKLGIKQSFFSPGSSTTPKKMFDFGAAPQAMTPPSVNLSLSEHNSPRKSIDIPPAVTLRDVYKMQEAVSSYNDRDELGAKVVEELQRLNEMIDKLLATKGQAN